MIALCSNLDILTYTDVEVKFNGMLVVDDWMDLSNYENSKIEGIILDSRPFDVTLYPNLKVISRVGVGIDNIDVEECRKRNIKICTTPCNQLTNAVADFTIMQLMKLMAFNNMRDSLNEKNILIIGAGHIGERVSNRLEWFGCYPIKFLDITNCAYKYSHSYRYNHIQYINKCLPEADIVLVHISGTDQVIGNKELALIKDNAYLLNMARAECVDNQSVLDCMLTNNKLAGYASDFYYDGYHLQFVKDMEKHNILITDHIASKTKTARKAMEQMALDNLYKGLKECEQ